MRHLRSGDAARGANLAVRRIPLSGAPGELLVVTGKRGLLVPHTLATEVDADALRVDGAEHSVRNLADALHARVSGAGPWELRAPGLVATMLSGMAADARLFDLDDLGAEIRQHDAGEGRGEKSRDVEHADAAERRSLFAHTAAPSNDAMA